MKALTNEEQKLVRFQILKYIDKICRENNIKYSITGGTLLGAIRHHGFIPWDDDIDVFLTRPEYQKLDAILSNNNQYTWLTSKSNPNYNLNFGRLIDKSTKVINSGVKDIDGYGVFVDICVVDGLPDNVIMRTIHVTKVRFLYHARSSATYDEGQYIPKSVVKKLIKRLFQKYTKSKGMRYWRECLEKTIKRYDFNSGKYVGNVSSQYGRREIMHRTSFDEYIELDFEGCKFMAIKGWEEYLINIYGDYMTLPPLEKRVGHHLGECYML